MEVEMSYCILNLTMGTFIHLCGLLIGDTNSFLSFCFNGTQVYLLAQIINYHLFPEIAEPATTT